MITTSNDDKATQLAIVYKNRETERIEPADSLKKLKRFMRRSPDSEKKDNESYEKRVTDKIGIYDLTVGLALCYIKGTFVDKTHLLETGERKRVCVRKLESGYICYIEQYAQS